MPKMVGTTFWCISCNNHVNIIATEKQWEQYRNGVKKIQDVFPELTPDEREIMITGMCGDCFDNIFKK